MNKTFLSFAGSRDDRLFRRTELPADRGGEHGRAPTDAHGEISAAKRLRRVAEHGHERRPVASANFERNREESPIALGYDGR